MPILVPGKDNHEIKRLCILLKEAEERIRCVNGERLMDGFDTNAEFTEFINDTRSRIETDSLSWKDRRKLVLAFAPTSDWDDCVGDVDLGNTIYELLCSLYGNWR